MAKMIDSAIAVTRVRVNSNCSCPVTYVLFRIFFCRRMPCILFIISKSRMCEKESQLDEYSLKMTHHDIKAAFINSAELCKEREFETRLTVWPWLPLIYFLVPYIDFSQNSSR